MKCICSTVGFVERPYEMVCCLMILMQKDVCILWLMHSNSLFGSALLNDMQ